MGGPSDPLPSPQSSPSRRTAGGIWPTAPPSRLRSMTREDTLSSPSAIPGSALAGPYAVGEYAAALRARLRAFARVQIVGELAEPAPARTRVYFELRDADGAIPCAAWRNDWEAMVAPRGRRCATACRWSSQAAATTTRAARAPRPPSPSRSPTCASPARATCSRRSSACAARSPPRGCSSASSACRARCCRARSGSSGARAARRATDVLAGLQRRGWAGRLVWASRPCRTATRRRRSRGRCATWPPAAWTW